MAHAYPTAADVVQLGDGNVSDIEVSELLEETPMLALLAAIEASAETSHQWLKKTGAPTAGSRSVNDGVENTKGTYTKVTQALTILDASFAIDIALLKLRSGDALKRREAIDHLKSSFVKMEKTLIYGDTGDANAFKGFVNETTVDKKDDVMVVDAAGTTVTGTTSVWAIRSGESGVAAVYGGAGRIELGEEYMTTLEGSATGIYDAMRTPIVFWGGCQVSTSLDLGRICNLTSETGKTLTDALLGQLIAKFPAGRKPNMLVMNTQSQEQLRASRTATSPTGTEAPLPESFFGIPIIITDQIASNEAVVGATA